MPDQGAKDHPVVPEAVEPGRQEKDQPVVPEAVEPGQPAKDHPVVPEVSGKGLRADRKGLPGNLLSGRGQETEQETGEARDGKATANRENGVVPDKAVSETAGRPAEAGTMIASQVAGFPETIQRNLFSKEKKDLPEINF